MFDEKTGKQAAGGNAHGDLPRQVLVVAPLDKPGSARFMRMAADQVNQTSLLERAWTLTDLRDDGASADDVQREALRQVASLTFDEVRLAGDWMDDGFCLLLLRVADFCGVGIADARGRGLAVSFAEHTDCVEEPAEVCPDGKTIRFALSELVNGTAPMPGVNRVQLVSAEGKVLEEGYYARHAKHMPGMDDVLGADDYEHYIVIDRFADWGMPREIGLMHLVDSGIGAYLEVVR